MERIRRALGSVALAWLFCQTATLTLAPAVFRSMSADRAAVECTCTHGDHATCPMHHRTAPGSTICLMRSADDGAVAAFSWLFNLGIVPAAAPAVIPDRAPRFRPGGFPAAASRPAPPDPPPPRA
jgi:hypothetical protein